MNFLMRYPCADCPDCAWEVGNCPRQCYWANEANGGNNFDNPNYMGVSEESARQKATTSPAWAAMVASADAGGFAFMD